MLLPGTALPTSVSAEVFAKIIEFAAPRHAAESGHLGGPTTSYPGPVFAFSDLVRTGSIIGTVETQHALLSPDQIIWEEAGSLFALSLKYFRRPAATSPAGRGH